MDIKSQIPKCVLIALTQLYELEQKLERKRDDDPANLARHIGRMKDAFAEECFPIESPTTGASRIGLTYENPMGQPYKETRTDLQASISGPSTENLVVVEVIKPIIRATSSDGTNQIVQQGIVIVESRKEQ